MNNLIAIDRNGGIGELNALITYDGSAYTIYAITSDTNQCELRDGYGW